MEDTIKVEMDLTDEMAKQLIELFEIEIEIMQGETIPLASGLTRYKFKCSGHKARMVRDFVHMVGSNPLHKISLN